MNSQCCSEQLGVENGICTRRGDVGSSDGYNVRVEGRGQRAGVYILAGHSGNTLKLW